MAKALTKIQSDQKSEVVAYLDPDSPGHRTIQTDHGAFLIRLERIDPNPEGGCNVTLNIGNPSGLEIQELLLKGEFGQRAPQLGAEELPADYSKRLVEWEKTLTHFERKIATPAKPNSWSRVVLPLDADKVEDIRLIRISLGIERARLENNDGNGGEYSVIQTANSGAAMVKTDYGPLLLTVLGVEPTDDGTRIEVMVGNPFGFAINAGTLSGQFGPSPPSRTASEAPALYQKRLQIWSKQMRDFVTEFNGPIKPL
ncbi:MAG: hypothetical protein KDN19_11855, partial [Verrucomicrobiae bacterium]|nr:hypothetical protein [Verrucomicrobiae bacterium]